MKYVFRLRYAGENFSGFQSQKNARTVEDTLREAVERIVRTDVKITGCSRTDAGVHAEEYFASVSFGRDISVADLPRAVNTYLPDDVAVTGACPVGDDFSLRRNVAAKTYRYLIMTGKYKDPFYISRAAFCPSLSNADGIGALAEKFTGTHDFRAFMATGSDIRPDVGRGTVRTVYDCHTEQGDGYIEIFVTADGFLYNMVRIIAGTLVEAAEGKIGDVEAVIASLDRDRAGRTMPAAGLYLHRVYLNAPEPFRRTFA
ncbi:MAG: tRNA pseudouridine(38-40) synthase TruA [Clostridia bacterium]|nr:tRNA pseudouridine(38-40) synthase TruA [Clostridia bacterium]